MSIEMITWLICLTAKYIQNPTHYDHLHRNSLATATMSLGLRYYPPAEAVSASVSLEQPEQSDYVSFHSEPCTTFLISLRGRLRVPTMAVKPRDFPSVPTDLCNWSSPARRPHHSPSYSSLIAAHPSPQERGLPWPVSVKQVPKLFYRKLPFGFFLGVTTICNHCICVYSRVCVFQIVVYVSPPPPHSVWHLEQCLSPG